jgi:hypothetical protein
MYNMTVIDTQRRPRLPDPSRLVLATDLEGTSLAGAHEARRRNRELFPAGQCLDVLHKKFPKEAFWPIVFSFPDKLHGALRVNPYDANAMRTTLYDALTMGADEAAYQGLT